MSTSKQAVSSALSLAVVHGPLRPKVRERADNIILSALAGMLCVANNRDMERITRRLQLSGWVCLPLTIWGRCLRYSCAMNRLIFE